MQQVVDLRRCRTVEVRRTTPASLKTAMARQRHRGFESHALRKPGTLPDRRQLTNVINFGSETGHKPRLALMSIRFVSWRTDSYAGAIACPHHRSRASHAITGQRPGLWWMLGS